MQEATIVERLREEAERTGDQDFSEAASLIERQQQVIDLLMKAVEPFAEYHAWAKKWEWPEAIAADDGTPILGRESYDSDNPPNFTVTVGSFRRAREAKVEAERILAPRENSRQTLGCMDWWDTLPEPKKAIVRSTLDRIATLPRETLNAAQADI